MTTRPETQAQTDGHPGPCGNGGFSLVELLVALALAALVLFGIVQVLSGSSATYRVNTAQTRVQEAARYATQVLSREMRMARSTGCGSTAMDAFRGSLNTVACSLFSGAGNCASNTDDVISKTKPLGYSMGFASLDDLPGTSSSGAKGALGTHYVTGDVLVSWGVVGAGLFAAQGTLTEARTEPITLIRSTSTDSDTLFKAQIQAAKLTGRHLALITDCVGSDIFAITTGSDPVAAIGHGTTFAIQGTQTTGADANKAATLSRAYNWVGTAKTPGPAIRARVFPFDFRVFFICCVDQASGLSETGDGVKKCRPAEPAYSPTQFRPALCRWSTASDAVDALVLDIVDLRATYDGTKTTLNPVTKQKTQQRLSDLAGSTVTTDAAWVTTKKYWEFVDLVHIDLLATSTDEVATRAPAKYTQGTTGLGSAEPANRRVYDAFGITLATRATTTW